MSSFIDRIPKAISIMILWMIFIVIKTINQQGKYPAKIKTVVAGKKQNGLKILPLHRCMKK